MTRVHREDEERERKMMRGEKDDERREMRDKERGRSKRPPQL